MREHSGARKITSDHTLHVKKIMTNSSFLSRQYLVLSKIGKKFLPEYLGL